MSFNNLSDLRSARGNFDSLMKEVEKMNTGNFQSNKDDGNIWKPTVDQAGNGYAVIRFLPAPQGEDLPWVRMWNHGFQGPTGKWYIENSLTTLQQQDPVSELNSELWNSGSDASKEIARKQKRRLAYFANIVIVKDPANPDTEGKVYMYKFGKKIFDKIMEAMKPEFEDESPLNPFDFWDGVNFKLKIRQVEGYRNYDKSEFEQTPEAVAEGDEAIEAIWKQQHSLAEMVDPKNFKSYDELKDKLTLVLGGKAVPAPASAQTGDVEDDLFVAKSKPTLVNIEPSEPVVTVSSSTDDEDAMSYFAKLAED
jgi:hypothetical protein